MGRVASTRPDAASITVAVLSRMLLATIVPCGVSRPATPSITTNARAIIETFMAASVKRRAKSFNPAKAKATDASRFNDPKLVKSGLSVVLFSGLAGAPVIIPYIPSRIIMTPGM